MYLLCQLPWENQFDISKKSVFFSFLKNRASKVGVDGDVAYLKKIWI